MMPRHNPPLILDLTKPVTDGEILSFVDALTRRALSWRQCDECCGSGKLEQLNPHLPLVDCWTCHGDGGSYVEDET